MPVANSITPSKALKIARNETIAAEYLSGSPYRAIADNHNLSEGQVCKIVNSDDNCRSIIDQATRLLISKLPDTINNYTTFLSSEDEKIRLEACRDIHKVTGISTSHTPPGVQQFIQINVTGGIDKQLREAYQLKSDHLDSDIDVIDIETVSEEI